MHARFYAPGATASGQLVTLPPDEAEHLTRVMRLHAGDAVRVFDGRGLEFAAVVERAARDGADVRLLEARAAAVEPRVQLTLAQAVLKADKMDDVVRDAVMMGVSAIIPVLADRSEVSLPILQRGHRQERWQRIAIVSAKQCGRAVVPEIAEPRSFDALVAELLMHVPDGEGLMFVEPGSAQAGRAAHLSGVGKPASARTLVMVGPEGGWSEREMTRASGVVPMVTLRGPTLRADVMSIVAMSALFAIWGEM